MHGYTFNEEWAEIIIKNLEAHKELTEEMASEVFGGKTANICLSCLKKAVKLVEGLI